MLNEIIPEEDTYSGLTHYLVEDGWANVLAFGIVAVGLLVATRGRLGYHSVGTQSHHASLRNVD